MHIIAPELSIYVSLYITIYLNPHWDGLIIPVRVQSIGQIELFNHLSRIIIITYLKQYSREKIDYITWD